jgi:hypothetical protein
MHRYHGLSLVYNAGFSACSNIFKRCVLSVCGAQSDQVVRKKRYLLGDDGCSEITLCLNKIDLIPYL